MFDPKTKLTPFDPTTMMTKDTQTVLTSLYELYLQKKVRFASRFTFVNGTPTYGRYIPGKTTINFMTWLKQLGLNFDGKVNVKVFITKIFTYFGYDIDVKVINTLLMKYGYTLDTVDPIDVKFLLFDVLGIKPTIKMTKVKTIKSQRRGKKTTIKGKKTTVSTPIKDWTINLIKVRKIVYTWYGQDTITKVDTKMLGMTIYAYSPSIRDFTTLFGTTAVAIKVVFKGNKLVVVDHKVTTIDQSVIIDGFEIKPWSRMTVYDIETDDHKVPFTGIITKLIKYGYITLTDIGIKDVATFINDTFVYGLNKAFTTWMDKLALINSGNAKIKDSVDIITTAVKKGYTPETVKEISDLSIKVFDEVDTTITDDMLVTVGGPKKTGFDLGIPTSFEI